MRHLRIAGLTILIAAGLFALTQKAYALDPPHNVIQCTTCHGTGKISTAKQGLDLSSVCLDCHRAGGLGQHISPKPANPYGTANNVIAKGKGTEHGFMGNDLNTQAKATVRPSGAAYLGAYGTYVAGQLSCNSCHDPHNQRPAGVAGNKFLRAPMTNDELCLVCHVTMDKQNASTGKTHPVKVSMPASDINYFTTPQYASLSAKYTEKGNKVTCTVCHKPHKGFSNPTATKGTGDGYLGRVYMNEWLCTQCHRKQVHGGLKHTADNVSMCQDCHSTHNPGNNVSLIKNIIVDPRTGQNIAVSYNGANFIINSGEMGVGICQACHTTTNYFRNYSATKYSVNAASKGHPTDSAGACLDCHKHSESTGSAPVVGANVSEKDAFTPSGCNSCHGSGSYYWPAGNVYPNYSGSHRRHTASFGCSVCHDNPGSGVGHYETPTYIPPADVALHKPNGSGGWANDVAYDYGNKDCSNAYCHNQTGRAITVWRWTNNLTLNCGSCHAAAPSTGAHGKHVYDNADLTECAQCHPNANLYGTAFSGNHGDGNIDLGNRITGFDGSKNCTNACHATVAWTSADPLNCDACHGNPPSTNKHAIHVTANSIGCVACHNHANYDASPAHTLNHISGITGANDGDKLYKKAKGYSTSTTIDVNDKTYNDGNTNTWNSGAKTCATAQCHNPSPSGTKSAVWTGAAATCTTCHDTASITTAAHQAHLTAAGVYGKTITCTSCHPNNTANNHFMTSGVPKNAVQFSGVTYSGTVTIGSIAVNGTCGTNTCHNDGKGGAPKTNPYPWNAPLSDCNFCHDSTTPIATGSHADHSNSTYGPGINYSNVANCNQCHTAATSIYHINGTKTFRDNNTKASTTACDNCHTSASAGTAKGNWDSSTSMECSSCHAATPANSKFDGTGVNAPYKANAATTGHGLTTGNYSVSNNVAANKGCTDCHAATPGSGTHIDGSLGSNYARLTGTNDNAYCTACHTTMDTHGNQGGFTGKATERTFSLACTTCHDVHGTSNIEMIRANIQSKYTGALEGTVTFTARTGANSFAGVGVTASAICVTCHQGDKDNAVAFTSGDSHVGGVHGTSDFRGLNCVDCHKHNYDNTANNSDGFMASCTDCHGTAPSQVWPSGTTFPNYSGSHRQHIAFNGNCAVCHDNPGGPGHNSNVSASVSIHRPNGFGGFTSDVTASYNSAEPYTCYNTYCHAGTTMTWKSNPAMNCGSCHSANVTGFNNFSAGAHSKHYESASLPSTYTMTPGNIGGTSQYQFTCTSCHNTPATHIDGPANAKGAGQIYFGYTSATLKGTYAYGAASKHDGNLDWSNGTCANTYCHSDGKGGTPANNTFTWATASLNCNDCHGDAASNTLSGAHQKHVNNAGVIGTNFGCADCHAKTVSGNTTISDKTKHVNKYKDYSGVKAGTSISSCNTAYCHSDGKGASGTAVNWTTGPALGCNGCHGVGSTYGQPNYANLSTTTRNAFNSHSNKHIASATDCYTCHKDTVNAAGTTIASGSTKHIDKQLTVAFDTAKAGSNSPSYDNSTKRCSNIYCHSDGNGAYQTVRWGQTVACGSCHGAPPATGAHIAHIQDATLLTTIYGSTEVVSNTTNYAFGCGNCHPLNSANHANGSIEISLAQGGGNLRALNSPTAVYNGTVGNRDGTCDGVYCHSDGSNGASSTFKTTPAWNAAMTSANKCGQCHNNPPQYAGQGHYVSDNFMGISGKEGGHMIGIHFDNIFRGYSGLAKTTDAAGYRNHGYSPTSTTIACYMCHSGIVSSSTVDTYAMNGTSSDFRCGQCHTGSTPTKLQNGAITDKSKHINGAKNVQFVTAKVRVKAQLRTLPGSYSRNTYKASGSFDNFSGVISTWDSGAKTCTTACHLGQQAAWNNPTTVTCASCHGN